MEVKVYPRDKIYDDDWQQRLEYGFVLNAGKLRRAYICSPLSAATPEDVIRNVRSARSYMLYALEKMELAASAPHAYLPSVLCDSIPAERALALDFGLKLLERCDILLVCGRRITAGMRGEIRRAAELKMEIRAFDSDVYETIFRMIGCGDGVKANIVLDKDHPLMAHSAPYAGGTPW